MSTYHERLRAALDAGHPTTGAYSGGNDAVSDTARINEPDLPGPDFISNVERAIRVSGKWTQYVERGQKKETDETFTNPAMHELMSAFAARTDEVNYRDAYWSAVIDACVAEGSMGSAAGEQLKQWSDDRRSHAAIENLGSPTLGDVEKAWSL